MSDAVWEMSHSVETDATLDFAWRFWTNVANWSDPPATFELEGPFVAGARGTTHMPGQEPRHWVIGQIEPHRSAVIEMPLGGAVFSTRWQFEGMPDGRTRLTQTLSLRGENAEAYREAVDAAFRENLPPGMQRIARLMAEAASRA